MTCFLTTRQLLCSFFFAACRLVSFARPAAISEDRDYSILFLERASASDDFLSDPHFRLKRLPWRLVSRHCARRTLGTRTRHRRSPVCLVGAAPGAECRPGGR